MDVPCRTYSVREAAQILGLGRNHTYGAIYRGEIPALRFGRRIVVPKDALDEMLQNPSMVRNRPAPRPLAAPNGLRPSEVGEQAAGGSLDSC